MPDERVLVGSNSLTYWFNGYSGSNPVLVQKMACKRLAVDVRIFHWGCHDRSSHEGNGIGWIQPRPWWLAESCAPFMWTRVVTVTNKEASWLYAEPFVNDEFLKNVNDKEWNLAICHVTLSLSQSEGSILSSLSDLVRNHETSPKKNPFKEHSCRTALLKTEYLPRDVLWVSSSYHRRAQALENFNLAS